MITTPTRVMRSPIKVMRPEDTVSARAPTSLVRRVMMSPVFSLSKKLTD